MISTGSRLVANDSGGAIAQAVMAGGGPRLARVVLTTCEVEGLPPLARVLIAPAYVPGGTWALAQTLRLAPVRRAVLATVARRPVPAAVVDALHRQLRADRRVRRDLGRLLRAMRARRLRAAAAALPGFGRPVLVVWGAGDRLLPGRLAGRLAELLPDARVELLDDCRTLVMLDRPDALAGLIADFVPASSHVRAGG